MDSNNKIGVYEYFTEPFHVDQTGRLTMSVLGNQLLNSAGKHAAARKFGITDLNEQHYTWVLSRLAVEFDDLPRQYEPYTITTWVEAVYSLFTDRNFRISNHAGETVGHARSIWAMIDMSTRRPVNLINMHGGDISNYVTDSEDCPIAKPGKIKVTSAEPVETIRARYSDIDINGHVNSVRYIEHILDLCPIEKLTGGLLKRFEIAYVTEAMHGDELDFYMDVNDNEYQIEVKQHISGDVVCRAKVLFKE